MNKLRQLLRSALKKLYFGLLEKALHARSGEQHLAKHFPFCHGTNYFHDGLRFASSDETYFTKYFADDTPNPLAVDVTRFNAEVIAGTRISANQTWRAELKRPSVLPIGIDTADKTNVLGNYQVSAKLPGETRLFGGLAGDRFYYLPVPEAGSVEIESSQDFIVGNPLPLTQERRHKKRFVAVIFIDAFAWDVIKDISLETELPNIHRFFSKGAIFDQCHATAEWTLPSVPTLMSGIRAPRNGMFDKDTTNVVGNGYPILSDLFQADDYLTFMTAPGGRTSPAYGYTKGFDRSIYRLYLPLADSLTALYDHLRAFPERDHFVWLGIMEAHHQVSIVSDISTQVGAGADGMDFMHRAGPKATSRQRDESSLKRYCAELRRIDFYLGQLFAHIETTYGEDEFLVALTSDHGHHFLSDSAQVLPSGITRVPMMMRGGDVPEGRFDEIVQTTDLAPSLLHFAGLPPLDDIDGRLPHAFGGPQRREFAVAESHFTGKRYNAVVRNDEMELFYTSDGFVDCDGNATGDNPEIVLYKNEKHGVDVSAEYPDIRDRFLKVLQTRDF